MRFPEVIMDMTERKNAELRVKNGREAISKYLVTGNAV